MRTLSPKNESRFSSCDKDERLGPRYGSGDPPPERGSTLQRAIIGGIVPPNGATRQPIGRAGANSNFICTLNKYAGSTQQKNFCEYADSILRKNFCEYAGSTQRNNVIKFSKYANSTQRNNVINFSEYAGSTQRNNVINFSEYAGSTQRNNGKSMKYAGLPRWNKIESVRYGCDDNIEARGMSEYPLENFIAGKMMGARMAQNVGVRSANSQLIIDFKFRGNNVGKQTKRTVITHFVTNKMIFAKHVKTHFIPGYSNNITERQKISLWDALREPKLDTPEVCANTQKNRIIARAITTRCSPIESTETRAQNMISATIKNRTDQQTRFEKDEIGYKNPTAAKEPTKRISERRKSKQQKKTQVIQSARSRAS
jgi:hypothetical protein